MNRPIFPGTREALITASILSFLLGLGAGALLLTSVLGFDDYISGLVTLLAAFLGAWSAFYLADRSRQKIEWEGKIMQLNKALFVLLRQINAGEGFARDVEAYPSDEQLAFQMPSYKSNEYTDLNQDFDGLAFLASTRFAQDLLHLTIEQERFEQILSVMSIRHEHYVKNVMPEMMMAGLTDRKATLQEVQSSLKAETYKGALQGAKQMRTELNAYRRSSVEMHRRLHKVARELFPSREFLKVDV